MQPSCSRIRMAFLALLLGTLAACGGGGSDSPLLPAATPVQTAPLRVEALVQQTGAPDLANIKTRSVQLPIPAATQMHLGKLLQTQDASQDDSGAHLVGAARGLEGATTADELAAQLKWNKTASGAMVAALSVSAEGAHGLRLGLLVTAMPGSAAVRVYSQQHPDTVLEVSGQTILQTLERNQAGGDRSDAARTWWTPELGEAEQTVEFELPAGTDPRAMRVAIPTVSHIFEDFTLPQAGEIDAQTQAANTCNLDANCYDMLAQQRNAVARMLYTKGGSTYACTGTLVNDIGSTGTPYFLSANHCISTQSVASTLQTDWFYRSASCKSGALFAQSTRRLSGATLLYASEATDTSFMRLNDAPPAGVTFAGWDASPVAVGTAVAGLHHPDADFLKISFGEMAGLADCRNTGGPNIQCSAASGSYYVVAWSQGTTEGGSSGSALFRNGLVVGTLYGGPATATCKVGEAAGIYGRFDIAYANGLKRWLSAPPVSTSGRNAVYRFFNQKTGAHFYTASADERDFVIRTYPDFRFENIAFYAYPATGANLSAVFRFFNKITGAHFYTISSAERDFVQSTYPAFSYEGPSWYAQAAPGGTATPMYRFFNTKTGAHFYTISAGERDFVIGNYADFRYEGPVYYAWTAP